MIRSVRCAVAIAASAGLLLTSCAAPSSEAPRADDLSWSEIQEQAQGQTVSLWMYGGDEQGNAYVDDVLTPAAAEEGVTLRRVPVESTTDAVNRILSERQAGVTDGEVDLVWVNGANFGTGKQAGAWLCGWTQNLPNMEFTDPEDPLLLDDFGTSVENCESPWHKAQFTLVYNAAAIPDPPTTFDGVLDWARANPGRFTYPAPPDFTGSVFVREALINASGGVDEVPAQFDQDSYDRLAPALFDQLNELAPALWREGTTYPQSSSELDALYAGGQVDMTMTYGPATLPKLVADGTFPPETRVLTLDEGTVGNASFLAIPSTSGKSAAAQVVANLALSPEQQLAKATPDVWGQFTALDIARLTPEERAQFEQLPSSPVVPSYEVISANAHPELSAEWVTPLDEGWRRSVLAGQ
ncbi:ABC transporter substrate-binding protein [Rhodococcus sp. NKCM2511]|uniref:ABC transporter substrate-binding protein n=1 Tax=Rhodococcus sp. NKCM2511 TaxID=2766011 RepID=UPI001910CE67|nr:ABC transporter substrate-binding protein [Rhodococcus sp. NKCM2511]GHP18492.1 ABC transporter substrate-binding protein [Rhodococcus sp. NKCM2511]